MELHSRRFFLQKLALLLAGAATPNVFAAAPADRFSGSKGFEKILDKARAERWKELPIGELIGKIALQLEGVPYKGGTLDISTDSEVCTVNLNGLDCVTFIETALDFARMLKHGKGSEEALLAEVRFTRYRGGKQGDYTTRLHYTSDWLLDNQRKGVLTVLSRLPGAEPFHPAVNFMTTHAQSYPQLAANPSFVNKLRAQEGNLNTNQMMFVPTEQIKNVESLLQTGDIVGLCSRVPGLDIEHTGLVIRKNGVTHFMDASSRKSQMKVTLENGSLHQAIAKSTNVRGAIFARPRSVTAR